MDGAGLGAPPPPSGQTGRMTRTATTAALIVLALAALTAPAAHGAAAKAPAAQSKPPAAKPKPKPVSTPGLETILQDDGLLLYRPAEEVAAAVRACGSSASTACASPRAGRR